MDGDYPQNFNTENRRKKQARDQTGGNRNYDQTRSDDERDNIRFSKNFSNVRKEKKKMLAQGGHMTADEDIRPKRRD